MAALSISPLDSVHRALAARMVPFGGWDMPVSYPAGLGARDTLRLEAGLPFVG